MGPTAPQDGPPRAERGRCGERGRETRSNRKANSLHGRRERQGGRPGDQETEKDRGQESNKRKRAAGQAQTDKQREWQALQQSEEDGGDRKNGASRPRHRERDGDTWAGGRSPTGWPGWEVPGKRMRLPAPCPLCSTRTRPGLQEPQEVSPLSPFRPEPGQAHQVEMGPHVHAGLHGAPQHHATLPMDGVAWQVPCVCVSLCSPNSHSQRLSNCHLGEPSLPFMRPTPRDWGSSGALGMVWGQGPG